MVVFEKLHCYTFVLLAEWISISHSSAVTIEAMGSNYVGISRPLNNIFMCLALYCPLYMHSYLNNSMRAHLTNLETQTPDG